MVDDGDAVAVLGLVHIVGREEDRQFFLTAEISDVLPNAVSGLRVEAQRGLIEEKHARKMDQPACYLQPSFHTAGIGADMAFATVPKSHKSK